MAEFISETFIGANGTLLETAYPVWTRHQNYADEPVQIWYNLAQPRGGISCYYHSSVPPSADYEVRGGQYLEVENGKAFGVCGRVSTSANTFYHARYLAGTPYKWQLYRFVNGVASLLGESPVDPHPAARTVWPISLRMQGGNLQVYRRSETTPVINQTDPTPITDAGRVGMRGFGSTTVTGVYMQSLSAQTLDAPAPTINSITASNITASGARITLGLTR